MTSVPFLYKIRFQNNISLRKCFQEGRSLLDYMHSQRGSVIIWGRKPLCEVAQCFCERKNTISCDTEYALKNALPGTEKHPHIHMFCDLLIICCAVNNSLKKEIAYL